MHSGYERLDREGGFSRVRIFAPLAHRDFRLLWSGMCVSLAGDGVFLVALAWQVYALSNAPTALATVGIAITVPTIVCLLLGGVVSDRFDRRRVMLIADCARAAAVGTMAILSIAGSLELWQVMALGALYGTGTAFFDPSFDAIVPEVLPSSALAQANSLDQLVRPLALRIVGPALGGVLVAVIGAGWAFALDAASFAVSAAALVAMTPHPHPRPGGGGDRSFTRQIGEGLRYVRSHPWLWATFASAAVAYLLFIGPTEVLVPFIVKNQMRAGALGLGLVYATGGLGSLLCAILFAQHGLPRRVITFTYGVWTLATLTVAGYGIARALWGLMLTSLVFNSLETVGTITWATAKQSNVPGSLLGRVSSLDWLISIGLLPLSYALTGPVSAAVGVRTTLIGAGVLGAAVTFAALLVPGVRSIEQLDDLPGTVSTPAA